MLALVSSCEKLDISPGHGHGVRPQCNYHVECGYTLPNYKGRRIRVGAARPESHIRRNVTLAAPELVTSDGHGDDLEPTQR